MSQNLEHGSFFSKPEIRLEDPTLLIQSIAVRRYGLGVITIFFKQLDGRGYTIAVKQKYPFTQRRTRRGGVTIYFLICFLKLVFFTVNHPQDAVHINIFIALIRQGRCCVFRVYIIRRRTVDLININLQTTNFNEVAQEKYR